MIGVQFAFVTVTWNLTSRAAIDDLANVVWLREAVRKWLKRNGVAHYDLGVREFAAVKGAHWHWLIHCPSRLRLGRSGLYHYLRGLLSPRAKGLQTRAIGGLMDCEGCGRARTWQHLALCYFLKGSDDAVRERNGINACASASLTAALKYDRDQGVFPGKRLYHSRSLADTAARAKPKHIQGIKLSTRPHQPAGDLHASH